MPPDDSFVMPASSTPDARITESDVYAAIADVLDPELDEPLATLGFIDRVRVEGPDVTLTFKLPTFWCAPNFAYLMASDLRNRIRALPGARVVRVELLDHSAEDEINAGINGGQSFAQAFAGEVDGDEDLESLRYTFLRKGFLMRQDTLVRHMLKAGIDEPTLLALRVADLVVDELADRGFVMTPGGIVPLEGAGRNAHKYLLKGKAIGLFASEHDALVTDERGHPIAAVGLKEYLRHSRSVRMNILFNTSMCKGLFRTRYENAGADEMHSEGELV